MGALGNLNHERFCQALHKRIWAGEKRSEARTAAYRDAIYKGDNPDAPSLADNARRLANQRPIKARLTELADYSAKLAGLDASWAMVELSRRVRDFNLADYLSPPGADRYFDISMSTPEQLGRLSELYLEDDLLDGKDGPSHTIRKTKLKPYDPASIIGLMAKIGGWESPAKTSLTDPDGNPLKVIHEVTWKQARDVAVPSTQTPA